MKRREFIAGLGGVAAWPVVARPQTSAKRPLIIFLSVVVRERNLQMEDAFIDGLRQLNYVAGRDFDFAVRSADGQKSGRKRSRLFVHSLPTRSAMA